MSFFVVNATAAFSICSFVCLMINFASFWTFFNRNSMEFEDIFKAVASVECRMHWKLFLRIGRTVHRKFDLKLEHLIVSENLRLVWSSFVQMLYRSFYIDYGMR